MLSLAVVQSIEAGTVPIGIMSYIFLDEWVVRYMLREKDVDKANIQNLKI